MASKSALKKIKQQLKTISNKRARIVIEHILKRGFITTEDLEKKYGYNHPPRAARDVREAGIPLETFRVQSAAGRSIAAYRFGDLTKARKGQLQGRRTFPKKFKEDLYRLCNGKCAICNGDFQPRYLQIDHRIPYLVVGEKISSTLNLANFMLVCGSCNRAKSWSCEHCPNGMTEKVLQVCSTCYWAYPTNYAHIALREIRRVDIVWDKDEIQIYERLKKSAEESAIAIPEHVKKIIEKHF